MHKRFLVIPSLLSLIVLLSLLLFSNPTETGPFGVLVFFISLYVFLFCICFFFVSVFCYIIYGNKRNKRIDVGYAVISSFSFVLFLLMRRMYELNLFAIFGIVLFEILGCILVKRRLSVVK